MPEELSRWQCIIPISKAAILAPLLIMGDVQQILAAVHEHKASRLSYVKSLVVWGGSSVRAEEPELLCELVISTATGNWLSHLDWDGHR